MAQVSSSPTEWRTQLRENLVRYFDDEELRTLCYDLGVDYDDLRGEGKAAKARELVTFLDHRNRIAELVKKCSELRPNVVWSLTEPIDESLRSQASQSELSPKKSVQIGELSLLGCQVRNLVIILSIILVLAGMLLANEHAASPPPSLTSIVMVVSSTPTAMRPTLTAPSETPDMILAPTSIRMPTVTPVPTSTPLPVSSTPRPTATPVPPMQFTATALPFPSPSAVIVAHELIVISPINGAKFKSSVIVFRWSGGALRSGETFLIEIRPSQANKTNGCSEEYGLAGLQYSPPLTEHEWTTDINALRPGELRPCAGRIQWRIHIRDATGNITQSTPYSYFEWNPL